MSASRRTALSVAAGGALLAASPLAAQTGSQTGSQATSPGGTAHAATSAPAHAAAHGSVEEAVEALRQAMLSRDHAKLEAITAEGLSYGHSSGRVENRQQFIAALVEGRSVFRTIELSEPTAHTSGDVAVVRHILTAQTEDGGRPGNVRIGVLLVFQRQSGAWKLLARQAVARPA